MLLTPLPVWWQELKSQRARTCSTLLGIGWGTFGVVAMLSFGDGLQAMLRERAEGLGKAVVIAWVGQSTRSWQGLPEGHQLRASDEDVLALAREVPGLAAVSSEYIRRENVRVGADQFRTTLNGVFPSYGPMRAMGVQPGGRFLDAEDQRLGRRVAFLGDRIKEQLLGEEDAIGKQLILASVPFTVIGVLAPKQQDSDYDGLAESRICVPASTYRRIFGDPYVDDFVFQATDPRRTAEVIDGVYRVLARRLHFDPGDRGALHIWDTTQGEEVQEAMFLSLRVLVGLAGGLTLLVGGLGVGNLMFLIVKRRTSEIGLQMALGARPRWVLQEVLAQTLLFVGCGGALGFLAAFLLARLVALTPLAEAIGEPAISVRSALGTVVLLTLVGLASGLAPARRAAGLDPIEALLD